MSELHLLRHGKAVAQAEGGPDRERPLEPRGRHAAQALGRWIAAHGLCPALVLCSPSLRTRQTLDIIAPCFPHPPEILIEEALYLAGARQLVARLRQAPADTSGIMLVGHNPGFYELALHLSEVATGPLVARLAGFPTGAMASYDVAVPWSSLDRRRARLTAVLLPKELRGAA